eukprot:4435826-Pyramimonas_sp.AAC.1
MLSNDTGIAAVGKSSWRAMIRRACRDQGWSPTGVVSENKALCPSGPSLPVGSRQGSNPRAQ